MLVLLLIPITYAAELFLIPKSAEANIGENFTINIFLENTESVYGLDFKLNKINGIELIDYEFLNILNNSMTNFVNNTNDIRFGILFAPDTNGLIAGNESIIKLTYKANDEINNQLNFSNIFLSNKNGNQIQTSTTGAELSITEKEQAYLTCTGGSGKKGEIVTIIVYAQTNTEIGGIDFNQNYNTKIEYKTAEKTTATSEAILALNPESNKIRIAIAGTNINAPTPIVDIKYEITGDSGDVLLTFSNITISDTNGMLIETSQSDNCYIYIEQTSEPETPQAGTGGGGDSSKDQNTKSAYDTYTSQLNKKTPATEEPTFFTQIKPEKKEEPKVEEKKEPEKTKRRTLPIVIMALLTAAGLGAVIIFELKK